MALAPEAPDHCFYRGGPQTQMSAQPFTYRAAGAPTAAHASAPARGARANAALAAAPHDPAPTLIGASRSNR